MLPDDQKKVLEMVEAIVHKEGFSVKIVDVTREGVFDRFMQEEVKKIRVFPTLITDSGEKIEGDISNKQIELLMSKTKRTLA